MGAPDAIGNLQHEPEHTKCAAQDLASDAQTCLDCPSVGRGQQLHLLECRNHAGGRGRGRSQASLAVGLAEWPLAAPQHAHRLDDSKIRF